MYCACGLFFQKRILVPHLKSLGTYLTFYENYSDHDFMSNLVKSLIKLFWYHVLVRCNHDVPYVINPNQQQWLKDLLSTRRVHGYDSQLAARGVSNSVLANIPASIQASEHDYYRNISILHVPKRPTEMSLLFYGVLFPQYSLSMLYSPFKAMAFLCVLIYYNEYSWIMF